MNVKKSTDTIIPNANFAHHFYLYEFLVIRREREEKLFVEVNESVIYPNLNTKYLMIK